ncbi:unnamed protein product [Phytomonas sp. EM1]|nr:unnamed protein product [Phytomonas sp. EM1]|eukprot:CCW61624.1 unnamed protein product [Phytomonas sp. isolate EM1]
MRKAQHTSKFWVELQQLERNHLRFRYNPTMDRLGRIITRQNSCIPIWIPDILLGSPCEQASFSKFSTPYFSPQCNPKRINKMSSEHVVNDAESKADLFMNAAFVEETDLFLFLLGHPLPLLDKKGSNGKCKGVYSLRGPELVFRRGGWESCAALSAGFSWLSYSISYINHHLERGALSKQTHELERVQNLHNGRMANPSIAGMDYLEYLIQPSFHAGAHRPGIRAEHVWMDAKTVQEHDLSCFRDAFWVPCHRSQLLDPYQELKMVPFAPRNSIKQRYSPLAGRCYVNTDQLEMDPALLELIHHAEQEHAVRQL